MKARSLTEKAMIKVLVVDDSAFYRQTFSKMLNANEGIEVIGVVPDGIEAIRFLSSNSPHVIVLDLEMPNMDGFTFLRWLMSHKPLPVVVVSARSEMSNVFKALELGAVDFLAKPTPRPSLEIVRIERDLKNKISLAATISKEKLKIHEKLAGESVRIKPIKELHRDLGQRIAQFKIVGIGASTGGPPAIQTILSQLPKDLSITIAIAQHMPPVFTRFFAERLNRTSNLPVKEASHGELVQEGMIYVAPGAYHMSLYQERSKTRISLKPETEQDMYVPSVDTLLQSISEIYGDAAIGVILTGMGQDGKMGLGSVKAKGGLTLAEDEETSVVFGMPKEAIDSQVVDKVLPIHAIAKEIIFQCSRG